MLWQYTKRDAVKNFFPLPNEIFSLGLSSGALGSTPTCSTVRTARPISAIRAAVPSARPST